MISRSLLRHLPRQRVLPAIRFYTSKPSDPRVGVTQPSERFASPRPDTAGYGDLQKSKPLNPHLTNHTCTNDPNTHIPKVGVANAPPELISAVEADSGEPENLHRMTGEALDDDVNGDDMLKQGGRNGPGLGGSFGDGEMELGVGEMAEAKFRIEPLRRQGEDLSTMRARLLCMNHSTQLKSPKLTPPDQSRKRGILETDLLLSTFADAHLPSMTLDQLKQYDLFLDENDWDIYYWTTQTPPSTSSEYAEGGSPSLATPTSAGQSQSASQEAAADATTSKNSTSAEGKESDAAAAASQGQEMGASFGEGPVGEWAQTVGRVKEPYRPPPSRWKDSEILTMLRAHVKKRAGSKEGGEERKGLGRMPDVRQF